MDRDKSEPAGIGLGRFWLAIGTGAVGLLAVGGGMLAFAPDTAPTPSLAAASAPELTPLNPATVALGELLYAGNCAACHGTNLEGQPDWQQRKPDGKLPAPPHDETGHTWHHTDAQIFEVIKFGLAPIAGPDYATDMPAYDGILSDTEIEAVIAYMKSRWPEEIRARQARVNAAAQEPGEQADGHEHDHDEAHNHDHGDEHDHE